MVKEQDNWIFYVLVAMLVAGMALTLYLGPAQSNHSYVNRGAASRGQ